MLLQSCSYESRQHLALGDAQLAALPKTAKPASMDPYWDVADTFRRAAVVTRRVDASGQSQGDLEAEAIAMQRLGCLYIMMMGFHTEGSEENMQHRQRGRECLLQCTRLAVALHAPRIMREAWHKEAVRVLHSVRPLPAPPAPPPIPPEVLAELRAELKPAFDALKAASDKGAVDLIRHLTAHHPPPGGKKLGQVTSDSLKKTILQAVTWYHPDKHWKGGATTREEQKTFLLYEEITKLLNLKYGVMKGVD